MRRMVQLCLTLWVSGACAQQLKVGDPAVPIDAAGRAAVVHTLGQVMQKQYVFPKIGKRVAQQLEARSAHGEYDSDKTVKAFGDALGEDVRKLADDRHLRVDFYPDFGKGPAGRVAMPSAEVRGEWVARHGYGITRVERLPGNVGLLRVDGFPDADLMADAYGSAMRLLSGTDALIIDLRQNGGGSPDAVAYLMSYFFDVDDGRRLFDVYSHDDGETHQYWSFPVSGPRYARPVYVLVSARTMSAGESFAYFMQTQKRATVIGDVTWGGANPGRPLKLGHGLVAFVPIMRAYDPQTGKNWEHVGVKPDVPADPAKAENVAYVAALKRLLPKAKDEDRDVVKAALAAAERGQPAPADYSRLPE